MSRAVPLRHTSSRVMKIHPYKIAIDEREILDLRRRPEQTRWPSQVQDAGWAMGMERWSEMTSGGHFAALEEPRALAADIREFARQSR